ncbi:MAG: dTDP-4-keto-6-deoxy-D-glucose epimerase, partial [Proteobacteria bacterium]
SVFDVAVDIRKSSPNLGRWVGVELNAANNQQLWIPPGFAHGFMVLSDTADFLYKTTDYYAPVHERSIIWNDSFINVQWPSIDSKISLAEKDLKGSSFAEADLFD